MSVAITGGGASAQQPDEVTDDDRARALSLFDAAIAADRPATAYFWLHQNVRLKDPDFHRQALTAVRDPDAFFALPANRLTREQLEPLDRCYVEYCENMYRVAARFFRDASRDENYWFEGSYSLGPELSQSYLAALMSHRRDVFAAVGAAMTLIKQPAATAEQRTELAKLATLARGYGAVLQGMTDALLPETDDRSIAARLIRRDTAYLEDSIEMLGEGKIGTWTLRTANYRTDHRYSNDYEIDVIARAEAVDECWRARAQCRQFDALYASLVDAMPLEPMAHDEMFGVSFANTDPSMDLTDWALVQAAGEVDPREVSSDLATQNERVLRYRLSGYFGGDNRRTDGARGQLETAYVRAGDFNRALALRFEGLARAEAELPGSRFTYLDEAVTTSRMLAYFNRHDEAQTLVSDVVDRILPPVGDFVIEKLRDDSRGTTALTDAAIGALAQQLDSGRYGKGGQPFGDAVADACAASGQPREECRSAVIEKLRQDFLGQTLVWLESASITGRAGRVDAMGRFVQHLLKLQDDFPEIAQSRSIMGGLQCRALVRLDPVRAGQCFESIPETGERDPMAAASAYYAGKDWASGDRVIDAVLAAIPADERCMQLQALAIKGAGLAGRDRPSAVAALENEMLAMLTEIYDKLGAGLGADGGAVATPDTGTIYYCEKSVEDAAALATDVFLRGDDRIGSAVLPQLKALLGSDDYARQSDCYCAAFDVVARLIRDGRRDEAEAIYTATLGHVRDERFYRGGDARQLRAIRAAQAGAALGRIDEAYALLDEARGREVHLRNAISDAGLERSASAYAASDRPSPTEALLDLAWRYQDTSN